MIHKNKVPMWFLQRWAQLVSTCQKVQLFQQRAWIVSIQKNGSNEQSILTDTFVVSEDSFSSPMSWMKKQHYSHESVSKIDKMRRSQVIKVEVLGQSHSLIRVK